MLLLADRRYFYRQAVLGGDGKTQLRLVTVQNYSTCYDICALSSVLFSSPTRRCSRRASPEAWQEEPERGHVVSTRSREGEGHARAEGEAQEGMDRGAGKD